VGQPVWTRYTGAISLQRFNGRVHPKVAVVSLFILPALVPVNRSLDSRIPGAKQVQSLFDPLGFVAGGKLACAPFRNHDRLVWIEAAHLFVGLVDQGSYVSLCLLSILLCID